MANGSVWDDHMVQQGRYRSSPQNRQQGINPEYNVWTLPMVENRGGVENRRGQGAFGNIPNIPNIGEGLSGTDRNWQSDQRKYNLQAAVKQNQEGTQDSYVAPSTNPFENIWGKGSQMRIGGRVEPGSKPPGESWYDKAKAGLGKLGASDYGNLFLRGVEAFQGYKAGKRAEEQQKFARESFGVQMAAYNKQMGYQRRGINNQLRMQKGLLESDFYADPERAKSLKLLEV